MNKNLENIDACVFDAYGTLFDINAAAAHCKNELGENWETLPNDGKVIDDVRSYD